MPKDKTHLPHHQKKALIAKRRFTFLNALLITLLVVAGGYAFYRATHAANATMTLTVSGVSCATIDAVDISGAHRSIGSQTTPFQLCGSVTETGTQIGLQPGDSKYPFTIKASSVSGYTMSFSQTEGNCDGSGCIVWEPAGHSEAFSVSYTPYVAPPSVTLSISPTSVAIGQAYAVHWSSSGATSGCVAGGSGYSGSVAASGTTNISQNSAGTYSYSLNCTNAGGTTTKNASVVVNPNPPPPPPMVTPQPPTVNPAPPPPNPTPTVSPTPSPSTGGKGGAAPSPSPSPGGILGIFSKPAPQAPQTPDTTAPGTPESFQATSDSSGLVGLSWNAASDDRGIKGYIVERSLDQKTWDVLIGADDLSDTSYADKTTTYNVHYYYRVHAIDTSGNQGGLATADVTTQAFVANTSADSSTTVTSDDGLVAATLPSGTVAADASCSLITDTSNKTSLSSTKLLLAAGPYSLLCRDASGNNIDTFDTDVTLSVSTTAKQFSKLTNFAFYQYDGGNAAWTKMVTTTDKKSKVITATTRAPLQFAVLGSAPAGIPLNLILIIIFILLIIGAFLFFRARQVKKQQYDEYIRHKYYDL
jgi:hypothetical protein